MVYVWIHETSGKSRFVDDQWLNPCRKCGERISACRANDLDDCKDIPTGNYSCLFCKDEGCEVCDQGCQTCGAVKRNACRCDNDYESGAGK